MILDGILGFGDCVGWVIYYVLNKDYGVIYLDGIFGDVGFGFFWSEVILRNFENVVCCVV